MDLFTITCDSCTSRLKVRQFSAIGQILACPKCGSMLQVNPPADWEPPRDEGQRAHPEQKHAVRPADSGPGDFEDVGALLQNTTAPAAMPSSKFTQPVAPPPDATDQPILPNEHWTADSSRQRRRILTIFGLATIVLVAAITMLLLFTGQLIPRRDVAATPPTPQPQAADPSSDQQPDKAEKSKANPDQPVDSAPAAPHEDSPSTDEKENVGLTAPSKANQNKVTDSQAPADTIQDPGTAQGEIEGSGVPPQPPQFPDVPAGAVDAQLNSIFDDLGKLNPLIGDMGVNVDEMQQAIAEDTSELVGIGTLHISKPSPVQIDVAGQLEAEVGGIRYPNTTLSSFLGLMTSLSGVPFSLDADGLRAEGIAVSAPLQADIRDSSVLEVVRQTVQPLGLQLIVEQQGVLVTGAAKGQIQQVTYELSPFDSLSAEELQRLAGFLQDSIDPASWDVNGGPGLVRLEERKLVVNQTPEVHHRIRLILTKLAASQQLDKDPGNQAALDQTQTLYARSEPARQLETEMNLIRPAPLREVLGQLERVHGITVIVDWPELIQLGWFPTTEIPWPDQNAAFEQTLRKVTRSMGLDYRIIGANEFEITSPRKTQQLLDVEAYPLVGITNEHRSGEQLVMLLQSAIQQQIPPGIGAFVIYEPQCNCILAYLPQSLQVRTERLLEQFRPLP